MTDPDDTPNDDLQPTPDEQVGRAEAFSP